MHACVCYLKKLADEAGGRLRDKIGDVETTREGSPEGVPGVSRQGFEGGIPNQHLKDEHTKGPVVCCLGCASTHDHLRSLCRQVVVCQDCTSNLDYMHAYHMSLACIWIALPSDSCSQRAHPHRQMVQEPTDALRRSQQESMHGIFLCL